MELWIRSQDRENLLKTDIVALEEIEENKEYWIYAGHELYDPYRVFGVYHTKERAIEVLDEIQKLIKPITIFQNCQVDKSTIEKIKEMGYCMVNNDVRVEQISQAFYQMPKD